MKKVLGIQASPNIDGHTSKLTQAILEGAKEVGAGIELIHLHKLNISACRVCQDGWGMCKSDGKCVIDDDDFQDLRDKMYSADAIVFNTPVYFGSMSETARYFLDRLRRCEIGNKEQSQLPDKPAIIMASARSGGSVKAVQELEGYFRYFKLKILDSIPATMRNSGYKMDMLKEAGKNLILLDDNNKTARIKLEQINTERIKSPEDIEKESFNILHRETDLSAFDSERLPIIQRVIHATADFEYKDTLVFHPEAIKTGINAIKTGKDILTDVCMVQAGISKKYLKRWGGEIICKISDEEVARLSEETGRTRSEIAMEKGFGENVGIVAIGNAPTALLKVIDMMEDRKDVLVIGVPVGFVKALDAKVAIANQKFPFITNLSRKGGSTIAVSIVNAILKMVE
jgi:precorrin-8X/cobalt-precorrin-8 methylmutase